ncbi:MAG: fused MFS/spermidine synthase [Candidatus Omnitrophota bacterium]
MRYPISKNQNNLSQQLAFVLGFTSIASQIVLLREFVTVFYGNEIAYAVILASWLFWVAAGSFLTSRFIGNMKNPPGLITAGHFLLFFILPATVVATRLIKVWVNLRAGEMVGILPMGLMAYVLLAPLTFILGGMFALICRFSHSDKGAEGYSRRINVVYLWESIGSAAGGAVLSFLLVSFLPSLQIVFWIGLLNILTMVFVSGKRSLRAFFGIVLALFLSLALASGLLRRLDQWTHRLQWKGFSVIAKAESVYGQLTLIRMGDEYSLYENGLLSYTTKAEMSTEENIHFPLLEHPEPKEILLIGNGLSGGIREILKYPQARVDYVELDPKVIGLSERHLPGPLMEPLRNQRVRVVYSDGRLFVKTTGRSYDVVIVNLPDPHTAFINRYYTLEFFEEVRRILKGGGIFSLSVSSSENYLNRETKAFLRSIHSTLKKVFPEVRSIPGGTNIFLAGGQPGQLTLDDQILSGRLKERQLETKYVREYYLPYKLNAGRLGYIEETLSEAGDINRDEHPIAYFHNMALWSTHFPTNFRNIIWGVRGLRLRYLLAGPVLLLLGGIALRKKFPASPLTVSIMTTGFSEIIFQIIVILAFQALYGYAYYKIGWIISSFMFGLIAGSLIARRVMRCSFPDILKVYKISQFAVCAYPLILPAVFLVFRNAPGTLKMATLLAGVFTFLPSVAGLLGGLQYPLAIELESKINGREGMVPRSAGFLYAADVLGASAGALLTGTLLVPLLGINAVVFFCVALNSAVWILLLPVREDLIR